MQENKRKK